MAATTRVPPEPIDAAIARGQREANPDPMNRYPGPETHYDRTEEDGEPELSVSPPLLQGVRHYHHKVIK